MGSDTRQLIADTALELFHTKGYTATGVLDITRAAGVPKGSFYHFFDSKESLALEAVSLYSASMRLDLLDGPSASPLQRIRDFIENAAQAAARDDFTKGCLLGNFSNEMPSQSQVVTDAVGTSLTNWKQKLAATITEAQAAGEITTRTDPQRLAQVLVAGLEGSLAQAKVLRSQAPLDDFIDIAFSDLLV